MPAITAKVRALTALNGTTTLQPAEVLTLVKQAAEEITTTGYGHQRGRPIKAEVRVRVLQEHQGWLALMIGSEKTTDPWTRFSAAAEPHEQSTALWVGGLDKYRIFQTKWLGLIPTGPAMIFHFSLYKKFLKQTAALIEASDPQAVPVVGVPGS